MKKFLTVVGMIVLLLISAGAGYWFSLDVNLWLAEQEMRPRWVARAIYDMGDVAEHLAATGQWWWMLTEWDRAHDTTQNLVNDRQVAAAMQADERYRFLDIEKDYPYFRLIAVEPSANIVDVWVWTDDVMLDVLYSDSWQEGVEALLEATAQAILMTHEIYPNHEYVRVFWCAAYEISDDSWAFPAYLHIAGSAGLFDWASSPPYYEALTIGTWLGMIDVQIYDPVPMPATTLSRMSDDVPGWVLQDLRSGGG